MTRIDARPGQSLLHHLEGTAKRAEELGRKFHSPEYCRLAALLHDYGKAAPAWQRYLSGTAQKVNHAPESAALCFDLYGVFGLPMAYAIKSHHSHLPDWFGDLDLLFDRRHPEIRAALDPAVFLPDPRLEQEILKHEIAIPSGKTIEGFQLWYRMIASTLIDSDRLDAEEAETGDGTRVRGQYTPWHRLEERFESEMIRIRQRGESDVNRIRRQAYEQAEAKTGLPRGFFTLNIPTGGGKTLCAMNFALRHRRAHHMDRIILAIPYTSIIEQTADVYKTIFGPENVLEHHSNFDPVDAERYRQAVENWDVPIVVTTNVQLFESLLKSGASEIRKLHNIVNSVILLDEAQMLPGEHLAPILCTLRALVENFGCSVVLCSATIPAISGSVMRSDSTALKGLPESVPLIDDPERMAAEMIRTRVTHIGELREEALAERLDNAGQVLCIVNTRKRCRSVFNRVASPQKYHLSATMCPDERREVLAVIRKKLSDGEAIVIVATSLIEAGVDIDVRTVYRELAGVDSISQAAGRCNREGKHRLGFVHTFQLPGNPPVSMNSAVSAANVLKPSLGDEWPLSPSFYEDYFVRYYAGIPEFDRAGFQTFLDSAPHFHFDSFSKRFNMIDNAAQSPLVVLYGKAANRIEELRAAGEHPSRALYRKLQPYTVSVPTKTLNLWRSRDAVETIAGIDVQKCSNLYCPGIGVLLDDSEDISQMYCV